MPRKSPMKSSHFGITRRSFAAGAGAAGLIAGTAPFSIGRAQGAPLKVGVLLPRSGAQAGIGQDCQRGVDIAPAIFKSLGLPELAITNADTETNVEIARARDLDVGLGVGVGDRKLGQTETLEDRRGDINAALAVLTDACLRARAR